MFQVLWLSYADSMILKVIVYNEMGRKTGLGKREERMKRLKRKE